VTTAATITDRASLRPDHAIGRWLASIFPDGEPIDGEPPLEFVAEAAEPPKMAQATVVEGRDLRAIAVSSPPTVAIAAFLDGRQESAVKMYRAGGVPIVAGTIGAVIRERRDRRMFTWQHRVDQRIYVPIGCLGDADRRALAASGAHVRDTTDGIPDLIEHPIALRELARNLVRNDRERLEHELAREWCASETRPLLIDGGISAAQPIARSARAIGVVKSHRTLYVQGDALRITLALGAAERTSVFLITPEKRAAVASWYLRLRGRAGHDPMWGLVRVEVSAPERGGREDDIGARADEVSRWILAEASPVALPDARWDKMVYGVRDCEEFLRAVM
jgi:hypothetical protein